jgi:hypothetical protein
MKHCIIIFCLWLKECVNGMTTFYLLHIIDRYQINCIILLEICYYVWFQFFCYAMLNSCYKMLNMKKNKQSLTLFFFCIWCANYYTWFYYNHINAVLLCFECVIFKCLSFRERFKMCQSIHSTGTLQLSPEMVTIAYYII